MAKGNNDRTDGRSVNRVLLRVGNNLSLLQPPLSTCGETSLVQFLPLHLLVVLLHSSSCSSTPFPGRFALCSLFYFRCAILPRTARPVRRGCGVHELDAGAPMGARGLCNRHRWHAVQRRRVRHVGHTTVPCAPSDTYLSYPLRPH